MLLSLSTTHQPATDLGFLLHKHPDKVQSFTQNYGVAKVFYPEASQEKCTAVLMLEIDPVGLVRDRRNHSKENGLDQYVNDRSYVASSFLSVALGDVFRSAIAGRCTDRPELVDQSLPLEIEIPVLACRAGEGLLYELFEPLGYKVSVNCLMLDEKNPRWGNADYYHLKLNTHQPLKMVLRHLYVLMPVLDNEKHYFVDEAEVEKLLRHGDGWLANHPLQHLITQRYLRYRKHLTQRVSQEVELLMAKNLNIEGDLPFALSDEVETAESTEKKLSLNELRLSKVLEILLAKSVSSVLDLGCGEGRLLQKLWHRPEIKQIIGMDVSTVALQRAFKRLKMERFNEFQQKRLQLMQGSLFYKDVRFDCQQQGIDAVTVIEVIEHLDEHRLPTFSHILFGVMKPKLIVLTTPNAEYNVVYENMPEGRLRHADHRFEWTRSEFLGWVTTQANQFGYSFEISGVGEIDSSYGQSTQMVIFEREK